MQIAIASGNQHKIREITDILNMISNEYVLSSIEGMNIPEPDEPYNTFIENAAFKAKYYAGFTHLPTLSEDSGLCVEALDNKPGVHTKDFAIQCGGLSKTFAVLESIVKEKNNFNASFHCGAALFIPELRRLITFHGKCFGKLSFPARGEYGFAFDPIFMPDGYTQVMAEIDPTIKSLIGHRGIAIRSVIEQLKETVKA